MEDIIRKRLLISKQFYEHGKLHSFEKDSMDRQIAIHHFDISVEIVLKNILLKHNIKSLNELKVSFDNLWAYVNNASEFKKKKILLPYESQIKNQRNLRNGIQHNASIPSSEDVETCRGVSRAFLEEVFERYFDEDYGRISLIELVENEWIKERLERAKKELENDNFEQCILLCYSALSGFRKKLTEYFLPELITFSSISVGGKTWTESLIIAFEKLVFRNEKYVLEEFSNTKMIFGPKEVKGIKYGFGPDEEKIKKIIENTDTKKEAKETMENITSLIINYQKIYM